MLRCCQCGKLIAENSDERNLINFMGENEFDKNDLSPEICIDCYIKNVKATINQVYKDTHRENDKNFRADRLQSLLEKARYQKFEGYEYFRSVQSSGRWKAADFVTSQLLEKRKK